MNQRRFPILPQALLAATSTYLYGDGQQLAAKIIAAACAEVVQTEYDNWNGGTYYYCLHIHISQEDFIRLGFDSVQTLQDIICKKLEVFLKPYPNQYISNVSITPTLFIEINQSQDDHLQHHDMPYKILYFIALTEKELSGKYIDDLIIAQELGLEVQDIRDWIDILELEGKVKTANSFDGYSALLTAKGRLYLKGIQTSPGIFEVKRIDPTKIIHIHPGGSYYESFNSTSSVNTEGGAIVAGDVNISGGNFTGRDASIISNSNTSSVK